MINIFIFSLMTSTTIIGNQNRMETLPCLFCHHYLVLHPMRILFVCLGNICRSPIADGLLRFKAKQNGLDWVIDSAGTESFHIGEAPHLFSQLVCVHHGIDISDLRARQFTKKDFDNFDIIYAMANDVYTNIQSIAASMFDLKSMRKVDYFLNELYPGCNASVPDPWYGPEEGYKDVYDLIDKTTTAIINKYK